MQMQTKIETSEVSKMLGMDKKLIQKYVRRHMPHIRRRAQKNYFTYNEILNLNYIRKIYELDISWVIRYYTILNFTQYAKNVLKGEDIYMYIRFSSTNNIWFTINIKEVFDFVKE